MFSPLAIGFSNKQTALLWVSHVHAAIVLPFYNSVEMAHLRQSLSLLTSCLYPTTQYTLWSYLWHTTAPGVLIFSGSLLWSSHDDCCIQSRAPNISDNIWRNCLHKQVDTTMMLSGSAVLSTSGPSFSHPGCLRRQGDFKVRTWAQTIFFLTPSYLDFY